MTGVDIEKDFFIERYTATIEHSRCPWARYEDAKPGSLRLSPPTYRLANLQKDYGSMQVMLFGNIPRFEEIIGGLAVLARLSRRGLDRLRSELTEKSIACNLWRIYETPVLT